LRSATNRTLVPAYLGLRLTSTPVNREATMPDEKRRLAIHIRDKLDAGVLPRVPAEKMWTGYGQGTACDGCDQPILPAQVEYESLEDSGDVVRLHIGCLGVCLAELRRRGLVKQAD
jgi:hypothetical protein